MKTDDVLEALEICEKLCFFGGQRAGRELWFGKPVDVQNKDIADFVRDVTFLKDFIADLEAKNKICAEVIARQDNEIDKLSKSVDNYESCLRSVEVIKANAIKEFAERLLELTVMYKETEKIGTASMERVVTEMEINKVLEEMTEEHNG